MRRKRKYNGMKIFGASTVILFLAVFLLAHFTGKNNGTDDIESTQESQSVTEKTESADTSENLPSETDPSETTVSESETEAETTFMAPKPDPADADNTWAMFLVNSKNPVPTEYCDGIETAFVYESWREYYMDSRVSEYMKSMIEHAAEDDIQLIVVSAYRSVEYQQNNFDNSVKDRMENKGMTYDEAYAATLKEVQLPGYSEHNAGVAADVMSDECVDMDDDSFKDTKAYAWLQEHAADYGFILRYPEGKEKVTGIIYEPWHYRFVGVYYAKLLTDRGITLEEYFEEMGWVDENGVAVDHLPELE